MNLHHHRIISSLTIAVLVLVPIYAFGQPTVATNAATGVSTTSANLNGSVTSTTSAATAHFDWGTTISYGNVTSPDINVSQASLPIPIFATLTGLVPNTLYHFRASASNDGGLGLGTDKTFTTLAAAPVVVTSPPQNVTFSSAKLVGTVNPNNSATDAHFDWGPTIAYGNTTPVSSLPADMADHSESFDLGSLSPNSTYHYRLSATNTGGTSDGSDQSFTTPPVAALPTATTLPPQDLSPKSAKLVGLVNPNGSATTAYFEWGPTALYGSTTTVQSLGNGNSDVQMNFAIAGLTPASTYHYRVVATNVGGTVSGNDQIISTPSIGPSQVPLLTPWGGTLLSIFLAGSVVLIRRARGRIVS